MTRRRCRWASLPVIDSALAAQAGAIAPQVLTQTRGSFTIVQTTQLYRVPLNKIIAYPVPADDRRRRRGRHPQLRPRVGTNPQQITLRTTNGCPDVSTALPSSCNVLTA